MRKQVRVPEMGDIRIKKFFAFFPISIVYKEGDINKCETRWLEVVTVKQMYYITHWSNIEFIDI